MKGLKVLGLMVQCDDCKEEWLIKQPITEKDQILHICKKIEKYKFQEGTSKFNTGVRIEKVRVTALPRTNEN